MNRLFLPLALWSVAFGAACTSPPAALAKDAQDKSASKETVAADPSKPQIFAPPTPGTGKSYTLRIKGDKVGDTWAYDFTVDTFADPKNMKTNDPNYKQIKERMEAYVKGYVEIKVKAVKQGLVTYEKTNKITAAKGTGLWDAQAKEQLAAKPDIGVYTWDERMTNVNLMKNDFVDPMTNSFHTLLPKEPVQVGSTWDYQPFPGAQVPAKAKLAAVEKVAGKDALRIDISLPAMLKDDTNKMSVWLDPSNCRYLKVTMDSASTAEGLLVENHFVSTIRP